MDEMKHCPFCGEKMYLQQYWPEDRNKKPLVMDISPICMNEECPVRPLGKRKYANSDECIKAWNKAVSNMERDK